LPSLKLITRKASNPLSIKGITLLPNKTTRLLLFLITDQTLKKFQPMIFPKGIMVMPQLHLENMLTGYKIAPTQTGEQP
jgi:hypothetical protein